MAGGQGSNFDARSAPSNGHTQAESTEKRQKTIVSSRSSLDIMEEEIQNQATELPRYIAHLKRETDYRELDASELVFTGSGDSFASSLCAHYFSGGEALAADPYELQQYPRLAKNRIIFITSVSGKTRANVQLARRVKGLAKRCVAVTAHPQSSLARECDDVIRLHYKANRTRTAGTLSFTISLLALASTLRRLPDLHGLSRIETSAARWARRVKTSTGEGFLFVGSGIGYALSAYGAFKIHEVLGEPAYYQHTEQLGHSTLFGLEGTENIFCSALLNDRKTVELCTTLENGGFRAQLLKRDAKDPLISCLEAAFAFQNLALGLARKRGILECAFLRDKQRLRLSSQLIY